MDTHGASLLRDSGDALFHVACRHHHEVVQFVDDHHDEIHALGHRVGALFHLNLSAIESRVVTRDVAVTHLEQQVVATFHLAHGPSQGVGGLLRIGHRLGEQMRQAGVLTHFDLLGVDQDHAHLIGSRSHEQRRDDAVDTARLASAGGTGDEEVRRGGEVQEHRTTGDVLSDGHVEWMRGQFRFGRTHQVAERHQLAGAVGHLDADQGFAGNRREDTHVGGGHRVGDVLLQARDTGHLHARMQFQFVTGDGRTNRATLQGDVDSVRTQRLLEKSTTSTDFGIIDGLLAGP